MKRIVSVWLPMWPIERLRTQETRRGGPHAVPGDVPLALVESGSHGIRITAVNERGLREGVRVGTALADARAALPSLLSRPAEPERDLIALRRLARWAGRYGPARNRDGEDGLWIDVTGVAHLFGGEAALLADLSARLSRFGITARLGLADTLGAAHALARYGAMSRERSWGIAAPGETRAAVGVLPVAALRLASETVLLLRRLGLKRIGQLYDIPRAALERRFRDAGAAAGRKAKREAAAEAVVLALDRVLADAAEPRRALGAPPLLAVRKLYAEPLLSSEAIENEARLIVGDLSRALLDQALAIRRIRLSLYRADGSVASVRAGLSRPGRNAQHIFGLLREKLSAVDGGFGIDALVLEADGARRHDGRQTALGPDLGAEGDDEAGGEGAAELADRLTSRLGAAGVNRLAPEESHIPERAEVLRSALSAFSYEPPWPYAKGPLRPPFLLERPEPITVMAEVPDGPPRSFTWRRVARRIARAEGPERIAPEWWRHLGSPRPENDAPEASAREEALGRLVTSPPPRPRDYYRIEDEAGAAYWVFRDGLYQQAGEDGPPRWFLHGLFG